MSSRVILTPSTRLEKLLRRFVHRNCRFMSKENRASAILAELGRLSKINLAP
jgi:hypothetical protein